MKQRLKYFYLSILVVFSSFLFSQNETSKWYFGFGAGLDFMTNPPTIISTAAISTQEGSASVADAAGNLLFYTDGVRIKNSLNAPMPGGIGLTGGPSVTQSALIIKQPGSNTIYYVFTTAGTLAGTINYSTVDMTLASGLGSVTVLNTQLGTASTEKLTAVRHCNGNDIWVISHDKNSSNFRCFLVTSSGVNSTPVNTSIGTSHLGWRNWTGYLRPSPNGKKLAVCLDSLGFELYDFDPSTGVVSNSLALGGGAPIIGGGARAYGAEFSPDGTKLYGTRAFMNAPLYQWDLCAGSGSAIAASQYTMVGDPTTYRGSLQLASNGKIYVSRLNLDTIGVINNPNLPGSACNFVEHGQPISPGFTYLGLPNFMPLLFKPTPLPFIYTTNNQLYGCQTASFNLPAVSNMSLVNCVSAGYSVTNVVWNFGDPSSGTANISTVFSPSHAYSAMGSYTAQVILYYSCGGGSDTLKQAVLINQPCFNVVSNGVNCNSPGSATVIAVGGSGPYSYTWMPTLQTTSIATGLYPGTYSITAVDLGTNNSYSATTIISSSIPFTGVLASSASVTCNGALTGSASINVSGGSGSLSYNWNSGAGSQTTTIASGLGAGVYTVTVADGLGYCSFMKTFTITQPPAFTLAIVASSPSACLGTGITFTAINSGGTPITNGGYTYTWTAGPQTNTNSINPASAGNYNYTVTSKDLNNCPASKTIGVTFFANPVAGITPNYSTLCSGNNLAMTGSGGTSYLWSGPNNFTANSQNMTINNINLSANGLYSLSVTNGSCAASLTQSITVFPLPVLTVSALPACEQHSLQFNADPGSGIIYKWSGPSGFSSTLLNPVIPSISFLHAGVYSLTVTDAHGCKASSNIQINVFLNPTIITSGATVCFSSSALLTASGATSYTWSGPSGFTSNDPGALVQVASSVSQQMYTVTAKASNGCTATTTASLNTIALPIPSISVTPRACVNSTVSLQGAGGDSYEWHGPFNFFSSLQNVLFTPSHYGFAGIYTLTALNTAGCRASKTAPLILDEQTTGSLQSSEKIYCPPFCADFNFILNSTSPIVNTIWEINNKVFNSPTFNYCFSNSGDYIVNGTFMNALGCTSTSTFVITANAKPKADFKFYPEKPVENFDQVQFMNTSTGLDLNKWNWFFVDNYKYKASTENTSYLFKDAGIYPIALVVENILGCSDTIVKPIIIMNDFNVYVPDAFTPNQDGFNDVFQPKGRGVVKFNLWIYDRWGEQVFQTNDFNEGWDGTFKGEDSKSDVYAWKIQVGDATGKFKDLMGSVILYSRTSKSHFQFLFIKQKIKTILYNVK